MSHDIRLLYTFPTDILARFSVQRYMSNLLMFEMWKNWKEPPNYIIISTTTLWQENLDSEYNSIAKSYKCKSSFTHGVKVFWLRKIWTFTLEHYIAKSIYLSSGTCLIGNLHIYSLGESMALGALSFLCRPIILTLWLNAL